MDAPAEDPEAIAGLYQRHGLEWDKARGNRLGEGAWLERFLAFIPPGGRVLDIGCGSGEPIGRYLIERGYEVAGIDVSPVLIGLCQARFPDHDWRVADMRTLETDRPFDGLIAWDSFFHLGHDDQRAMFAVFRRCAAERAALMFTSGPAHGVAIGEFAGEPLCHASLDPAEYRALMDEHGFEVAAHVAEDPDCVGRTVWLARLR